MLRGVDMGKVDLPQDYRAGMEKLLAEELETEKIRYTLELKETQVKQTQLEAEADKVRREKAAEAAGAGAGHRRPRAGGDHEARPAVQAEADRAAPARGRGGQGRAHPHAPRARPRRAASRRSGEADSRQKLADAEAYRLELVGKANAEQMEREGALIAHYPLLIQKTLADKLSDKIQVIIAPTPAAGRFIGSNLLGSSLDRRATAPPARCRRSHGRERRQ